MLIKNGYVYNTEKCGFEKKDIAVSGSKIADITEYNTEVGECFDAAGRYIIPGLVDVHTHGRAGYDFVSCEKGDFGAMARDYAKNGVTAVMPTLASAPLEKMRKAAADISEYIPDREGADFVGVHLEGRYLNPEKRGAHRRELLSVLEPGELECEEFRMCRKLHISAAYELDENGKFAEKALGIGATLGLGHTMATYKQALDAEKNGVTAYTHLYNAMPPLHHRDGGAVCAALCGGAFAEIICDGIHISGEMIKLAYRMKGRDRLVLISDSMEATGCPDGEYSIAGNPARVCGGIAYTPDGALAGSTLSLFTAVKNLMKFCDIPLTDALRCATLNPCLEVGCAELHGSIEKGKYADLVFLDGCDEPRILSVMLRGKFIRV